MKEIKVLGSGCASCEKLFKLVKEVVTDENIKVEKVDDIQEIMKYNVISTPALVIDGKVVLAGSVPNKETLKKYIDGNISEGCPCSCGGKC